MVYPNKSLVLAGMTTGQMRRGFSALLLLAWMVLPFSTRVTIAAPPKIGHRGLVCILMSPFVAPTSLIEFRRAVAEAIDREALVSSIRSATAEHEAISPATSILDPLLPRYADGSSYLLPFNPTESRKLVSTIGWTDQVPLTLIGVASLAGKATADIVAHDLETYAGIRVSLRSIRASEAVPLLSSGSVPIAIGNWISGYPALAFPNSLGIAKTVYYRLPDIRALVDANDATGVQKALMQQVLVVPLYFSTPR